VENAFNSNDGPAPYTIFSAEILGVEQAIFNPQFNMQRNARQSFNGSVELFIRVFYRDGFNVMRNKFITTSVPIQVTFSAPEGVELNYTSYLENSHLENVELSNNTLHFSYVLSCTLLITAAQAKRLAVLENPNEHLPNLPTRKSAVLPIDELCALTHELSSFRAGIIPFVPPEEEVIYVSNLEVLPGFSLLEASSHGISVLSVAFPVNVELALVDDTFATQQTYLYVEIAIENFAFADNMHWFAQFTFTPHDWPYLSGNIIFVPSGVVEGTICQVGETTAATVAEFVDCGPLEPCRCTQAQVPSITQL